MHVGKIQTAVLMLLLFAEGNGVQAGASGTKRGKSLTYEVNVRSVRQAPVLDGILSRDEWKQAAVVYNFTQKEPDEGLPASEPTFILISYDESHIYFGIRCFDQTPNDIVATEMRRDYDLSENDYVEIIIDTFHDQRNAYYFATNSLGAQLDCEIKTEGTHLNWDWDGIWQSNAHLDELGWTAEVAIPFQTLRFDNQRDLTWGINFGRYLPGRREESYWSPVSRDDDFDDSGKYMVSKFGTLNGLRDIGHEDRFQIKPFSTAGLQKDFTGAGTSENLLDAGLDAKIHITSNLVSDLTVNTDFAQVEADEEQVNLSRFNLFLPEKRDFFLEGLDVFNIGDGTSSDPFALLFFSRSIGISGNQKIPIVGGAKMTGKEGKYEIGLLDVYSNDASFVDDFSGETRVVPQTNYSAFRIKRDVLSRSTVGFMALSKDPKDGGRYNRTFAADGNFTFENNLSLGGYLARTVTPGLKGDDYSAFAEASWGNDLYSASGSATYIGDNFNPEMGFMLWNQGIRKYGMQMGVSPRPRFLNTRQTHLSYNIEYITDHNNELQYRTIQPSIFNVFKDESYLFISLINYYDNTAGFSLEGVDVPAGVYTYNVLGASYRSDMSRRFAGSIGGGGGSFYGGSFLGFDVTTQYRPNDKFAFDMAWDWNRVALDNGEITTSILSGRFNYSFSTDLFVKTYIQWNHFSKRIVSNILLNYIHSPGSDFFLVYNEKWDTKGGISTRDRAVLAKLTYLLKL